MKKTLSTCLFIFALCASAIGYANELTEAAVRALVDQVDRGAAEKNAALVAGALSDNAVITLNFTVKGQSAPPMAMSKEQYVQSLKEGWSQSENYQYRVENLKITLVSGTQALVTADVKETLTMQGQTIESTTQEETTVELVGGKPRITKIIAYGTM